MPYTLTLVANGIRCHYTQTATHPDIADAVATISAELDVKNVRYVIHDFSQAERLDSGIAAQLFFAVKSRAKASTGKLEMVAVVTMDEVFSYLIEEFKKHSSHQTKVFRTLAEAEAWVTGAV